MKAIKLVMAAACLSLVGAAVAGSNPKCSACKMVLSSRKDKGHTVAVHIGKKTYYCCAGCKMNAKKKHAK